MATLSDIQNRKVTLHGWRKTPTIKIRRKKDNAIATINLKDFDPILHAELKADEPEKEVDPAVRAREIAEAEAREKVAEQEKLAAAISREEMAGMTAAALKKLPQWNLIPANEREKARTKEQILALLDRKG